MKVEWERRRGGKTVYVVMWFGTERNVLCTIAENYFCNRGGVRGKVVK